MLMGTSPFLLSLKICSAILSNSRTSTVPLSPPSLEPGINSLRKVNKRKDQQSITVNKSSRLQKSDETKQISFEINFETPNPFDRLSSTMDTLDSNVNDKKHAEGDPPPPSQKFPANS